jgi:hypothetical protein
VRSTYVALVLPLAEVVRLAESPRLTDAVELARESVAVLARHPANRQGWARNAAAAGIRAARASAVLDGARSSLDHDSTAVADPVLAGAVRCSAAVGSLAGVFPKAPMQALARLHVLAAADLADPAILGRPRPGTDLARLAGVAELVVGRVLPAPLLVGVVHGDLLALRPFDIGGGVVARAAARLAMVASGLDERALGVPEVGFLAARRRYDTLAEGYADGGAEAAEEWLAFCCDALVTGAREGRSIAEAAG